MKNLRDYIVLIISLTILLWFVFTALSCTPQRRLNRLMERHPYLATKDTLVYKDTVRHIFNGVYKDTILQLQNVRHDTTIIRDKQLTIRTFVHRDSIFISGECDTLRDTTIIEKHIPYEKFIYKKPRDALIRSWGWPTALIVIAAVILVIFLLKRYL